jgi:hypothetical protein
MLELRILVQFFVPISVEFGKDKGTYWGHCCNLHVTFCVITTGPERWKKMNMKILHQTKSGSWLQNPKTLM